MAPSPYALALPPKAHDRIAPDPLRLRVDFHDESVVVHDYSNGETRVKLVSARDVAHALARELDLTTGVLPPGTVWWANTANGVRVAVWRESFDAAPKRLHLPMPGLVFVCLPAHQAPYVFAAKERPTAPDTVLYRCPAFNVFASGRVCTGTHRFPADPARVPAAFFDSHFSVTADTQRGRSHRHPDDVGKLWAELDGRDAYPVDDLVEQLTVADALRLGE